MTAREKPQAAKRVTRTAHQNALLLVLAAILVFAGLRYADARIGLWIAAGLVIAAAALNLVRVARLNLRMTRR